jgi:thiol-disulfide isomerase/thioredoxin
MKALMFLLLWLTTGILPLQEKQNIKVYDFSHFEPFLQAKNDTTYIVNFWATWCVPCRKELPDFEKFGSQNKNKPIKILLVSLDMAESIHGALIPFIEKNNIRSTVVVLDDPNSNYWINKVDSLWSGTIPATLIFNKNYRGFFPYPLTYEKLDSIVHLNTNKL